MTYVTMIGQVRGQRLDLATALPHIRAMSDDLIPDAELDALGLLCPLPVLKARKRLQGMAPGAVLKMLADDPAAAIDVPHFCAEAGHTLLSQAKEGATLIYLIQKAE